MLYALAPVLSAWWGPFRLFRSYLFLMIVGAGTAAIVTWYLLPRTWHMLPRDGGRVNTPNPELAKGKPTGAGSLVVVFLVPLLLLVMPFSVRMVQIAACLVLAMLAGYGDDRTGGSWSELRKGSLDAVIALLASLAMCQGEPMTLWIPLHKADIVVSPLVYVLGATALLWLTINATNCSDGVDGLAGTLTLLSVFYLAGFLYMVIGHTDMSAYLLVPHNPDGARWAVLLFTTAGALAGYLWHNAEPSRVLMGDAGSRFLGLLVGVAVLAGGNPLLILVVAPVVLVNGGTGLVKVTLLRIFRRLGFDISQSRPPIADGTPATKGNGQHVLVRVLHKVRFPLHDHCRKNLHWSNAQVLMRFVLLQAFLTPLLLGFLVKLR